MSPFRPGAVVMLGLDGEGEQMERERVRKAFASASGSVEVFCDGAISIAVAPEPNRQLHISDHVLCLLEGVLYVIPGAHATPSSGAATLASAYEQLGEELLPQLRGEFWALLWSRRRQQGLVVADQLGTRGPYWAQDGRTLMIASEVPELLASLSRRPDPDPVALAHWLMVTGPRPGSTLFSGLRSVEAGHYLRLGGRRCSSERYWSPAFREPLQAPREDQAAQLRDRLEIAVDRRRGSDEGTGVLLSGGIDSSTVAALAARRGGLGAYSAVFPDHPGMDEGALIARTVRQLGIDWARVAVRGGSTIRGALGYIDAWGLPPTSPNLFFWNPLLERAASDGIEVMLDGEGGDELFAFSPYLVADRLVRGRFRSALDLAHRWPGEPRAPSRELVHERLRLAGLMAFMPAAAHRLSRRLRGLDSYAPAWLPRALAKQWLQSEDSPFAWKEISGPRWWAYLVHLVTRGAGPAAVYEQSRRRGHLAGVTAAHPLVDVDVIEFVLRLDPEFSFDPRFNRAMLRDAIAGLVNDDVRLRRGKSNFDVLFHELLSGPELPAVRKLLDPSQAHLGAYVDTASLWDELLVRDPRAHSKGLARWASRVWRLVTAECWLRAGEGSEALGRLQISLGLPTAGPDVRVL